jgi:hypothetical protein
MRAAIILSTVGCEYDLDELSSADLTGQPVHPIAQAYVDQRSRYPDLTFREFLTRAVQGEDVLTAAQDGSFLPRAAQSGWLIRFEVGPMTGSEVLEFLKNKNVPPNTMVWDPGRSVWVRADAIKSDMLGAPTA